jgi:hypothetical protein
MVMTVQQLVELGKAKVLGEYLLQCHSIHHRSHTT